LGGSDGKHHRFCPQKYYIFIGGGILKTRRLQVVATKEFITEIEALSEEKFEMLRQFAYFLKHRDALTMDDDAYLSSIPGMMDSIREGVNTPLSECVPIEEVWPDV
jgi:CRISPR/Cas system-associated exonuclease Cas4 (RecB family)